MTTRGHMISSPQALLSANSWRFAAEMTLFACLFSLRNWREALEIPWIQLRHFLLHSSVKCWLQEADILVCGGKPVFPVLVIHSPQEAEKKAAKAEQMSFAVSKISRRIQL